jgi:hypothetical protein
MKLSSNIKIAIVMKDDTVSIMTFIVNDNNGYTKDPTNQNIIDEIEKMYPSLEPEKIPIKTWYRLKDTDIPTDRTYRNAWRHDGKNFHHDMNHAKEIHKDIIREQRSAILIKLDTDYIRADEVGDTQKKKHIAQQKQLLRDATTHPIIKSATTIEDLKLAIPPIFNEFN